MTKKAKLPEEADTLHEFPSRKRAVPRETVVLHLSNSSELEEALLTQFKQLGVPEPERQFILPGRRFLYDFAWPKYRMLVEVQGGTYKKNRTAHSTGAGLYRDFNKNNHAVLSGWSVLYTDSRMVGDYSFALTVQKIFFKLRGDLS